MMNRESEGLACLTKPNFLFTLFALKLHSLLNPPSN